MSCQSDPTRLSAELVGLLQLLANQAAIMIENARLYEELARKERRLELFVDRVLRMVEPAGSRTGRSATAGACHSDQ